MSNQKQSVESILAERDEWKARAEKAERIIAAMLDEMNNDLGEVTDEEGARMAVKSFGNYCAADAVGDM